MEATAKFIPEQKEGEHNDVVEFTGLSSPIEAHKHFLLVKNRLKDISNWHQYVGQAGSTFAITDTQGNAAYKIAEKGDVLCIDMPGPGPAGGDGYDWVRIEEVHEHEDETGNTEYYVMTVRPVANPRNQEAVTHFFSHDSTNTFIVERSGNKVSAEVHGRNEKPNTDGNLLDKARNFVVGLTARHGLSAPHWQTFVGNLLKV
ncbi:hypothetical protein LT679_07745 [Mucilaginibacter roseus]|uniref:Uncharacterized protein n=1 Tax=Mucilaginibacter roseus TaxID=1528868 RepID=A0ABS8U4K6_9SPHI|nr:hypothetical protein [Mucilaginibacter roseus]MCD8740491.1 hypothetical protein [Mucilaginibacter roseus]